MKRFVEGEGCGARRGVGVPGPTVEPVYAIVFLDCLRVKIRDEGAVKNKAVYLALRMRCSGHQEVLGIWIE